MRTVGWFALVVGIAVCLLIMACGGMASNRAAEVASQQHGCPRNRVRVIGEGGHWQYWLDVCGRRRLYTTMDGDYRDITHTVE